MGYCQTKRCHEILDIRNKYGEYKKIPDDIKKSLGLCCNCCENASDEDLERGGMDRD